MMDKILNFNGVIVSIFYKHSIVNEYTNFIYTKMGGEDGIALGRTF